MSSKAVLAKHTKAMSVTILVLSLGPATAFAQAPTDPYLGMEGHILDAGNIQLPYRLARPLGFDANKRNIPRHLLARLG